MKLDSENTKTILEFILSESGDKRAKLSAALYLKTTLSKVYDVRFLLI